MSPSPRKAQVRQAADAELLDWIADIARRASTDENLGDWTETRESIIWVATRGRRGRDWGHMPNRPQSLHDDD